MKIKLDNPMKQITKVCEQIGFIVQYSDILKPLLILLQNLQEYCKVMQSKYLGLTETNS